MKKTLRLFGILVLVLFLGCEKEADPDIDKDDDIIKIVSVLPSKLLEDGMEYTFSVKIEYDLLSTDSGILLIGYNTERVDSYRMISEASVIIDKGSGLHTFEVTTRAKNWNNAGDFKVYVNLSEYPHPPTWYPLASDTMTLKFK
jgi:hypothetical protein